MIWLGDLNYRIALSYTEAKKLVQANDWGALFEKDQVGSKTMQCNATSQQASGISVEIQSVEQLKTERESGVFRGWNEGKILFAPTYKYSWNSDTYAGEDVSSKKKRRTPAW